ncbi:MAG: EF-P lysine aminoacylase EpmA [Gemmatimonadota bacterium]|nr:EF-P lysine aminoacylase EpmA [Gemmatimonadota bacterium]
MQSRYYPSRMQWRHQPAAAAAISAGEVAVRGRLLHLAEGRGRIADESGGVDFVVETRVEGIKTGDIVELYGIAAEGVIDVTQIRLLVSSRADWSQGDWTRFHSNGLWANMRVRAAVLDAVRSFFKDAGFLAVETPTLARASAQEEHIQLFATEYQRDKAQEQLYLAPSPELYMKRLLGVGFERIYQISRSYRNGEMGPQHNPEFALIEWYRAYASYEEIMADVENLVIHVVGSVLGRSSVVREGREVDLQPPWKRLSVRDAFARWAAVDLDACADAESLFRRARVLGYDSARRGDSWEDLYHKILLERVEPELAKLGAVHLFDYPRQLAALAKLKEGDPAIAERTEAYLGGVELSNGYTELNDPAQQRERFARGVRAGGAPADEAFLVAMERGIPPAGGVALGLDRLVMIVVGASCLDEVIAFPLEH